MIYRHLCVLQAVSKQLCARKSCLHGGSADLARVGLWVPVEGYPTAYIGSLCGQAGQRAALTEACHADLQNS